MPGARGSGGHRRWLFESESPGCDEGRQGIAGQETDGEHRNRLRRSVLLCFTNCIARRLLRSTCLKAPPMWHELGSLAHRAGTKMIEEGRESFFASQPRVRTRARAFFFGPGQSKIFGSLRGGKSQSRCRCAASSEVDRPHITKIRTSFCSSQKRLLLSQDRL